MNAKQRFVHVTIWHGPSARYPRYPQGRVARFGFARLAIGDSFATVSGEGKFGKPDALSRLVSGRTGELSSEGANGRNGGIAVPMVKSGCLRTGADRRRMRARTRMSKRTRFSDRCEAEMRFRRKPEPKAALTSGRSIGGKTRSHMRGTDLRECEPCGSVEGRDCSAAKRRVSDGSDRKRRRVWTSVPARRSWPTRPGMSAARKGAAFRFERRKCDTRRPAAQVSMPPETVEAARFLSPGTSERKRGKRRALGSNAGGFFRPGLPTR